jgi:competence protein ComEC
VNVDLRLVAPAVFCWLAAGVLIGVPAASFATAALLAVGAASAIGFTLLSSPPARRATVLGVVAVSLAAAAVAASAVAVIEPIRRPDIVHEVAQSHIHVTATVVIASIPSAAPSLGPLQRSPITGTMTELMRGRERFAVSVPVTLYGVRTTGEGGTTRAPLRPDPLRIGAEVVVTATLAQNPPEADPAARLFATGELHPGAGPPWWSNWASEVRSGFSAAASNLPGDGGDLLPGLAIGDRSAVNDRLDEAMKTSSLSHLTAVSGANCAIIIACVMLLGGLVRLPRGWRIAASLFALCGFVVLVTPEPSVLRAAVMATIVMLSLAGGRPGAGIPALSATVIVLVVSDPWLSRSFGFALSVLATAGLLVLAAPLGRVLGRWMPGGLAGVIAIPVAAQLACQPVLILLNPSIPLYGVPANLLAAPAAPAATVLGLLAALLLPILPGVAEGAMQLAWLPAAWIAAIATASEKLPGGALPWWPGAAGAGALAAVTLLLLAVLLGRASPSPLWRRRGVATLMIVTCLYAGSLMGQGVGRSMAFPADWQIAVCDIGQGDAVVVRDGSHYGLIDVGPDPGLLSGCLDELGIDRLELLVLTHFDLDHVGGIDAVIGRVDAALVGIAEDARDQQLRERLVEGGATLRQAQRGDAGTLGALAWHVLWPAAGTALQTGNDGSVTVAFDGRGIHSLFLGDLGEESQHALQALAPPGRVDVVKVAHHGSGDQSAELYVGLSATAGLISVGDDNGYGHPTARLLDILAGAGTFALRTDIHGMVVLASAENSPPTGAALTVWIEKPGDDWEPDGPYRARPAASAARTSLEREAG